MSLIPGFSSSLFPQGSDKAGQLKVKRYMTIMDSMTDKELDASSLKELEKQSRMMRLARGAGRPLMEVQMLFEEFKRLGKIFNTALKGMKIPKNMKGGDINMNPRQMQQSLSQMSKMLPQGMMKQMGGLGGLQNLMKSMEGKM